MSPHHYFNTFRASYLRDSNLHIIKHPIIRESVISCKLPLSIEDEDADAFVDSRVPHHYALIHKASAPFIAEIPQSKIASCQSLIMDQECLYLDSYHDEVLIDTVLPVMPSLINKPVNGQVTVDWVDQDPIRIPGAAIVLSSPHSDNYHHWILETLPRIWAIEMDFGFRDLPIVVPRPTKNFQVETLRKLLDYNPNIIYSGPYTLSFDSLIFPSFLAPSGHSFAQLEWLRSHFLTRAGDPKRLIYISRKDANNGRKVINENEISKYLLSIGFEEVLLDNLNHAAQVTLFTDARIIIGASGAGITNHIFSPPGAHVIEFHPKNYTNRAHFFTSNILEQTYQFVIGEPIGLDLYVPIERVKRAVERVL